MFGLLPSSIELQMRMSNDCLSVNNLSQFIYGDANKEVRLGIIAKFGLLIAISQRAWIIFLAMRCNIVTLLSKKYGRVSPSN